VATSEVTGPLIICTRQETIEDTELSPELVDTEGGVQRIYKVLLRSREVRRSSLSGGGFFRCGRR